MEFATMEDEQNYEWDRRRHALAQLLQARGCAEAAAIVAASQYRTDYAGDNTYDVTLAVPAALYDAARSEFSDDIKTACIDIVGSDQFSCITYRVLSPPFATDWVETIARSLGRRWVPSERATAAELVLEHR